MYLSLLHLNTRSRQVQSELANPYEMHRTIMTAFPDGVDRKVADILYRLDTDARSGALMLLVQSQQQPNWHTLNPGYLDAGCDPNPQTKVFDLRLRSGQLLAFRLRANPTVKHDGKRHGLFKEDDQLAWLARKGADHGFAVRQVQIAQHETDRGWQKDEQARRELIWFAVRFDGVLEVTDPAKLRTAVMAGIGSAKAFGFGLLSLAQAQG